MKSNNTIKAEIERSKGQIEKNTSKPFHRYLEGYIDALEWVFE